MKKEDLNLNFLLDENSAHATDTLCERFPTHFILTVGDHFFVITLSFLISIP